MPHAWQEGSAITPHVHWTKTTTSSTGNVNWIMTYEIVNNGDVTPFTYATTLSVSSPVAGTPDSDTSGETLISSFGSIDMTGYELSCLLFWKISRDPADAADTYEQDARLIEFDIHYQIDAMGSEEPFTKEPH